MADKAILFGINDYKSISDLRGCENDLSDIRRLLTENYGFMDTNVRTFSNAKVVRKAVEEGFDWLAKESRPGDRLVFHYSGHGSYTSSRSGDKDIDQLICLYDMDWNNEQTFIRDSDLGRLARKVDSGARLTVILDSCHSGTGTRGITSGLRAAARVTSNTGLIIIQDTANRLARQQGVASDHADGILRASAVTMQMLRDVETPPVYARFVEPPAAIRQRISQGGSLRVRMLGQSLRAELNHQLLAAASETQTAADAFIGSDYHGAFSYYLCDTARNASSGTFDSVMQQTRHRIQSEGFSQNPQLEGPFNSEPLFGRSSSAASPTPTDGIGNTTPPDDLTDEDQFVAQIETPDLPCGSSAPAATVNSAPLDTLNHLLRVSEKLIDLARQSPGVAAVAVDNRRALTGGVIVYVHGISEHLPGYSQAWHNAITPHLSNPLRRAEVRWSQHVNSRAVAMSAAQQVAMSALQGQVEAEFDRRIARMEEIAGQRSLPGGTRASTAIRIERPRSLSVDDFTRYMMVEATRELILKEFTGIVVPELAAGRTVHIVSHSWGTVVAWEGLRRLDPRSFPGHVANLFVAGSALSVSAVQSNLLGRIGNGRAPVHVRRIANLDAGGDIVGGPIGNVFTVDREFLGLDPTGCRKIPFTGIAFNPRCAHSSYFVAENRPVNRDIFAAMINSN